MYLFATLGPLFTALYISFLERKGNWSDRNVDYFGNFELQV